MQAGGSRLEAAGGEEEHEASSAPRDQEASQRPVARRDAWWTLAVVSILYVSSYLNRLIITMVVPDLKASLAVSDFEVGIILGPAFALSYAAFGIPFGWAADRFSRRLVILGGALLFAVGTALSGLAASFGTLLLLRICVGLGEASLSPAALSLIAEKFPRERLTTAISIFSAGPKLGTTMAFALGGLIVAVATTATRHLGVLSRPEPWRLTFAITALPSLLIGLLCLTIREPARIPRGLKDKGEDGAIRFLVAQRRLMVPMLVGFSLTLMCGQALTAWVPTYLQRSLGWTALGFGPILGFVSALGAATLVVKGMIMDWLFARGVRDIHLRFYTWLLISTLPIALACFLVPSRRAFVLCYFVVGVVTIPSVAYASVAIQIISPPALRGRVFAIFSVPLAIFSGLGPLAVGALTDYGFRDENKLGWSLAAVLGVSLPAATLALRMCLPGLRRAIDEIS